MEIPRIEIKDKIEIWAYIGFIISNFGALPEQLLIDINNETAAVNYFEFVSAFTGMQKKELIYQVEKKNEICWQLTDKGVEHLKLFNDNVPISIREKTLTSAKKLIDRAELERSVICRIIEENGKFYVSIRLISETNGEDILSLRLTTFDRTQAEIISERFLARPNEILPKIMNMLTKDDYFMYN